MIKVLGLDYGRKKIGLAVGDTDSKLAEPLKILRYKDLPAGRQDIKMLFKEIQKIAQDALVEIIVVGISEGKMAQETKEFGRNLEQHLGLPVVFQDETLTTHEAKLLSIKAGIKRKKRKEMEDAYSAALILQGYLDNV